MSYSVCVKCQRMVPLYEKYCELCLLADPQLKQDLNYWKPLKERPQNENRS